MGDVVDTEKSTNTCLCRDYLWTGPSTYLTRDHLWKIYDLDETWDKVGHRRDKVAKASSALWKLMDGEGNSDNEGDEVS